MNALPQYLVIILLAMDLGGSLYKHGEPRTGNYSVWVTAIAVAGLVTLLYFGRFFAPLGFAP